MREPLPLIGRKDILDEIRTTIEQRWGEGNVICLFGLGGIGKTRMLQEVGSVYKKQPVVHLQQALQAPKRVILVQQDGSTEWGNEFVTGVESMAEELNITIEEHDAKNDLATMETFLRNAIQAKPDALLVREGSDSRICYWINQAAEQGIPTLTFDNYSRELSASISKLTHNESSGIQEAASKLREQIEYAGDVAIIRGAENDILAERRAKMFQGLSHDYPDIHIDAIEKIDDPNATIQEQVERKAQDVLRRFPNLKAFWTTWNAYAKPLTRLLVGLGRTDVAIYSFDLDQEDATLMIQKGSPWKQTVVTEPWQGGRILVRLATQRIYNEEVASHIPLLPKVIHQDDLRNNSNAQQDHDEESWTPLLRSIVSQIQKKYLLHIIPNIYDFDHAAFRYSETLWREIALNIDPDRTIFASFLQAQVDYTTMQHSGVSAESLVNQKESLDQEFIRCFNIFSEQKRVVMCFDTLDKERLFKENFSNIVQDFASKLPKLKNTVVLLAGREAHLIGEDLRSKMNEGTVSIKKICSLDEKECQEYLDKKEKQLRIPIESELAETLIFLSEGTPILLDLAAELRKRGITLETDKKSSLMSLSKQEIEKRHVEFKRMLVRHLAELNEPLDALIVLLSYAYPLNVEMIACLLKLNDQDASELFQEAKQYMFIKVLPGGKFIKLHDVMQDLINDYDWDIVDPEWSRRKSYSRHAWQYYEQHVPKTANELRKTREEALKIEGDDQKKEDALLLSLQIQEAEETLWLLKKQQLRHALVANREEGVTIFVNLFAEADTQQLRQDLFNEASQYASNFSSEEEIILQIHRIKLQRESCKNKEDYKVVQYLCDELLTAKATQLKDEQVIDMLIVRGNVKIRQANVDEGLKDFENAVQRSQAGYAQKELPVRWVIKAENELGWAYRLRGELEEAKAHYLHGHELCLKENAAKNPVLQYDYGMILNNLAFVLSNQRDTREEAENIANRAIAHWKKIGNKIGLGAAYIVSGIGAYRSNKFRTALEQFEMARQIFEPLHHVDFLGQIYAWRGATFREQRRYQDAETDLKKAIAVGTENIKAMAYNRLGRVYMSKEYRCKEGKDDWSEAKRCLETSLDFAEKIPDYLYGLVSLARLIVIAAEEKKYEELTDWDRKLTEYLNKIPAKPDQNNKGIAYIALARLAFGQRPANTKNIVSYLKKGIESVTEFGSYADRDGLSRLKVLEKDFSEIPDKIIREVGSKLVEFVAGKVKNNIHYNSVLDMMHEWSHWGEEGGQTS